jgi:hypothetical protein
MVRAVLLVRVLLWLVLALEPVVSAFQSAAVPFGLLAQGL